MIERDYIMRMLSMLATMLARILLRKQERDFPGALHEIDAAGRTLLGVDRGLLAQFSPGQLMTIFGSDESVAVPKSYVLAVLIKEEADVLRLMGRPEEAGPLYLRSLSLFIDTLFKGGKPVERRHQELTDEVIECLGGWAVPGEMLVKMFRYQEWALRYGRAEDLLFEILELQPEFREEGLRFYRRLMAKSDAELEAGNLPRAEVLEGMQEVGRAGT